MFLEDLEIITAIAKTRSLSRAAKLLYLSRPAISNKIDALEAYYGVKFYERTPQGITLTQAGQVITEYSKKMLKVKDRLEDDLADLTESYIPTMTVGASLADGVTILPSLIHTFCNDRPNAKIHLDSGYEPELLEKLRLQKLDFAIVEDQCKESDFCVKLLGYKKLVCLAPNCPPFSALRQPVEIANVLKLPLLIYERESGKHLIGGRHFRRYGFGLKEYNVVARLDSYQAMFNAILSGLGYCWLPDSIASQYLEHPQIISLDMKTEPIYYEVNLVYHKMAEISEEVQAFINLIAEWSTDNYFEQL